LQRTESGGSIGAGGNENSDEKDLPVPDSERDKTSTSQIQAATTTPVLSQSQSQTGKRKINGKDENNINGQNMKACWEKKRRNELDVYFYCKTYHPLGIQVRHLNNFRYLHGLFDPKNSAHFSEKSIYEIISPVNPNAVSTQSLVGKAKNMQNLEEDEKII